MQPLSIKKPQKHFYLNKRAHEDCHNIRVFCQGPAVPPLDRAQHALEEKTDHKVFADRTVFHHENESQTCHLWTPVKTGIVSFGGHLNDSENKSNEEISGCNIKKVTSL